MQAPETLLQRMNALFVASHYRNMPHDLQLATSLRVLFLPLKPLFGKQHDFSI